MTLFMGEFNSPRIDSPPGKPGRANRSNRRKPSKNREGVAVENRPPPLSLAVLFVWDDAAAAEGAVG